MSIPGYSGWDDSDRHGIHGDGAGELRRWIGPENLTRRRLEN